jgi:Fur family transcriptional regulator, ferric uptake regulator
MDRDNEIERRLKSANLRTTEGRTRVLDHIKRIGQPLSVPELHEFVGVQVPLSSLYRIVSDLVDAAVLRKLEFAEGFARYELDEDLAEHHHHLVCTACGSVVDLALDAIEARLHQTVDDIAATTGFRARTHRLDFFGTCASCATAVAATTAT